MQPSEISAKPILDIPAGATVTIKRIGRTSGFDGHCLRAYAYFGDQMSKVIIPTEGKAYKYEADDGTVKYYHESDPELQELIKTVCLS